MKNYFNNIFKKRIDTNAIRNDSFVNVLAKIGYDDKSSYTFLQKSHTASTEELAELYQNNGIAKRIVDTVVDESTRGFINTSTELLQELNRLQTRQHISEACKLARLFGNAIIVAIIDDGKSLDKPVNTNAINRITSLVVFDSRKIAVKPEDISLDIFSQNFGKPEFFTLMQDRQEQMRIHASRCWLFSGDLSVNTRAQYWKSTSILQVCYTALKNYDILQASTINIVTDFVQVIMKMSGLDQKMATEGMGEQIKARLNLLRLTLSGSNMLLLDANGEDYEKKSSNISGLSDIFEKYADVICASVGIPATKLFGKSPSGLNATGLNDTKNWYDVVSAYRSDEIEPFLHWFIELTKSQRLWTTQPDDFTWSFPSLVTLSEQEISDVKLKTAQMHAMYIDRGAVDAKELWQKTFGTGKFISDVVTEEYDEDEKDIYTKEEKAIEAEVKKELDEKVREDAIIDALIESLSVDAKKKK